jgi:hypothetical protein
VTEGNGIEAARINSDHAGLGLEFLVLLSRYCKTSRMRLPAGLETSQGTALVRSRQCLLQAL